MRSKNRFSTPSIRRRVTLAFLLITVLVIVLAAATYLQLRQVQPFSEQIIRNSSDLVQLQKLGAATAALDADLERYLVIRGVEYLESVNQDLQKMVDALTILKSNASNEENPGLAEIESSIINLQLGVQNVLDGVINDASSGEITRNIVAVYDEIEELLLLQQELSAETVTSLQTTAQTQSQIASNVVTQSVILGVIVIGITMFATFTTDRRLRTIITLTNTTTAIAEGDLTREAPVESNDEIGTLAVSFNTMTKQLRETLGNLEQQVADRTLALETSTEVSRRLSTILDQDQLVREVVEQLQTAFGYYHAHIYLFDEHRQYLVMAGGTGDAGRTMLARGHKLEKGQGLVGRSAERNQVILIPDIAQAEGWLPNPLLPDTKSEVAVPIVLSEVVLGVLDVQHDVTNGLNEQDAALIQSIANQIAIAVQNAQAYTRSQHQAAREAQITAISQRIQAAMTIEDVLQIAVSELGNTLGARSSNIDLQVTALSTDERI